MADGPLCDEQSLTRALLAFFFIDHLKNRQ